jgi:hypothetical protein
MPNDVTLTVVFHRNDNHRERIPLRDCTLVEAMSAIERVFYISDGLYTKAEIYRGKELLEIVQNPVYARVESILVQ